MRVFKWAVAVTMFSFGAASRSGPGGDGAADDRARGRMVADQIAARQFGKETQLASLEIGRRSLSAKKQFLTERNYRR